MYSLAKFWQDFRRMISDMEKDGFFIAAYVIDIDQIGQKIQKLEIFTFGQFWLVGLVGRKMVVGI